MCVFFFPSLELIPHFISEPLSTVQKPGATIKLYCSTEPSTAHLSWIFNGEKLHKKIEQVDPQPGSLTIFSLSPSNSGTYQCVANNSIGAIISRPATVSIACKLYSDWWWNCTPHKKFILPIGLFCFWVFYMSKQSLFQSRFSHTQH